jgi:hypothetical protein
MPTKKRLSNTEIFKRIHSLEWSMGTMGASNGNEYQEAQEYKKWLYTQLKKPRFKRERSY